MYIVDLIKRNKMVSFLLLFVVLGIFVAPSACNGVTGWGLCYTEDAQVGQKNIHLSPLNYILPPPPDWMMFGPTLNISL